MISKKQQTLDLLISGYENLPKGSLTPNGEGYLSGLKQARKIIYGDPNKKKK